MIDLDALIRQANEMAPFPATTVRLAQMVSSPDCNITDVAELISYDQSLTVKILRAVNSAANSGATRVVNVKEAVTRMGTAQVLALTVAAGARPHLIASVPSYGLDERALWRHSVAAAVAAEVATGFCSVAVPPELFATALLHDVGKLVMGRFLDPEVLRLIGQARDADHLSQLDAESLLLGANHGEIGGLIAQHWELPTLIVLGITYHHDPQTGNNVICDFTCLADQVANQIEASLDGRDVALTIRQDAAERLGTTSALIEKLCPVAALRFEQVSRRYNAV